MGTNDRAIVVARSVDGLNRVRARLAAGCSNSATPKWCVRRLADSTATVTAGWLAVAVRAKCRTQSKREYSNKLHTGTIAQQKVHHVQKKGKGATTELWTTG